MILDLMSDMMGGSRSPGKCAACPREFDPADEFEDELSRKEYEISNLCRQCQDSVFSEPPSDDPPKADPVREMAAILATESGEPAIPELGWSTWGHYSQEDHEDDICEGPAEVVSLPYSSCVVADIDSWVGSIDIPRADAVVKTDRGSQWVYLDRSRVAKDKDFLLSKMDFQHAMFSRERGAWNMRARSKQSPYLPRHMVGLTDPGKVLAAAWNSIVEQLVVLPENFQHPEEPPAPTSILVGGRYRRCQQVQFDTYRKVIGRSGATWIFPASGKFRAADIHCRSNKKDHNDGYYGSTLEWKLEDGSTCSLQGPWHSGPDALYEDAGIDLRQCHQTWCAVGRGVRFLRGGHLELIDPIYVDEEVQESAFDRGDKLGERLANKRREPLYVVRESSGGGCYGWMRPTLLVKAPGLTVLEGSWPVAVREGSDAVCTRIADDQKRAAAHTVLKVNDRNVFEVIKHPNADLIGWKGSFAALDDLLDGKPQPRPDLPEARS